jgi:hypothetical protein
LTAAQDTKIGIGGTWGLRLSYGISRAFALETSYSYSRPDLSSSSPVTGVPLGSPAPIGVRAFELNGLYGFGRGRLRGYAGLGAGIIDFDPPSGSSVESGSRFAANIALGGKYFLTDAFALRLDARYRWRVTDSHVSTVLCGSEGCRTFTSDLYSSAEVTGGVTFRFGSPFESVTSDTGSSSGDNRFFTAAGEVILLELVPWAANRYIANAEFAHISVDTVTANFEAGYGYDRDHFKTNQSSHPFHGSLFFNSARSNGYNFWESGAFALAGSFLWEGFMEREPPAINDLVNTTLGGMTRGEIGHRLSTMVLDNTASGGDRFWRELGGALLNPVGAFNRLIHGELSGDFPNPPDRFPSSFVMSGDIGYRHIGGDAAHADQGIASLALRYGDPFAGEIDRPFDSFQAAIDINAPGGTLVSRIVERGILKGWELSDPSDATRHILGVSQEYIYSSNEAETVGAQAFSSGLTSRYTLGAQLRGYTEVAALAFPMAAVLTTNFINPRTGRNYDYGPGGGLRAEARLVASGHDVGFLGYTVAWQSVSDGTSKNSTLQFFRAAGRIPIVGALGAGAGFDWYSRKTTYTGFVEPRKTQSEGRAFLTWLFK